MIALLSDIQNFLKSTLFIELTKIFSIICIILFVVFFIIYPVYLKLLSKWRNKYGRNIQ
jgi:hypothetical protein